MYATLLKTFNFLNIQVGLCIVSCSFEARYTDDISCKHSLISFMMSIGLRYAMP